LILIDKYGGRVPTASSCEDKQDMFAAARSTKKQIDHLE